MFTKPRRFYVWEIQWCDNEVQACVVASNAYDAASLVPVEKRERIHAIRCVGTVLPESLT